MQEYLLFIDTETTDLPKKWHLSYDVPGNWPCAVQVSWRVYCRNGTKLKEQNYFIKNYDGKISATALGIHGITHQFLTDHGTVRSEVLQALSSDLQQFQPMIIGHFLELDYHILGAEYYREGIHRHPMEGLPCFCIMTASRHLQQNPHCKYLKLGELYHLLFHQPLLQQHNALADAAATADCFFELVRKKEITSFTQPPIVFAAKEKISNLAGWVIVALIIIFTALLIACYYG